jgi:hypothetical protein
MTVTPAPLPLRPPASTPSKTTVKLSRDTRATVVNIAHSA